MFGSEIMEWLVDQKTVDDFSTQVIPQFIQRIATWENRGIHRDIGQLDSLLEAQNDCCLESYWPVIDAWDQAYQLNPIHDQLVRAQNG